MKAGDQAKRYRLCMFGAEDVVGTTSCEISLLRAKAHSLKERLKLGGIVKRTSIRALGTSLGSDSSDVLEAGEKPGEIGRV